MCGRCESWCHGARVPRRGVGPGSEIPRRSLSWCRCRSHASRADLRPPRRITRRSTWSSLARLDPRSRRRLGGTPLWAAAQSEARYLECSVHGPVEHGRVAMSGALPGGKAIAWRGHGSDVDVCALQVDARPGQARAARLTVDRYLAHPRGGGTKRDRRRSLQTKGLDHVSWRTMSGRARAKSRSVSTLASQSDGLDQRAVS